MKSVIVLLAIVGMFAGVGQAALIGWEAEDGSSFSGTVSATPGADFDPALSDAGALGGACITSETDGGGGSPGTDARTVSYSINFVEAGTYDLYARLLVVNGNADDSLFYAREFGDADPTHDGGTGYISWCTVNGIDDDYAAGEYHWINLSTYYSPYGESPSSFTVSRAGTLSWELGAREDGLWIDALAFGTSGETFTDAQLNTAVTGIPEPPTVEYNPILSGADPDVLLIDNKVWLYPTTGDRDKFYAFSSATLADWPSRGAVVFSIDSVPWMPAGKWAWAPGVYQKNGMYYLYYSAGPKPSYIGVASSTSPAGPFINRSIDGPLLADYGQSGFEAIDAMVFTDPQTGKTYFYAGGSAGSKLRVFELNPDMISFHHEITVNTPYLYTEGPFMHYRNGIYYMSYSHGYYKDDSYSVHYSIASSPTGPWTYQGALLVSDYQHKAPGHHSFLYNAAMDEWYVFYHRYNDQTGPGPYSGSRQLCIEHMHYNPDGTIAPIALTDRGVDPVWLGNFLRADFDESGQVEISDLMYLSGAWLTNDNTADMAPVLGDNIVDLQDFAAFGRQWLMVPQSH